jgi:hypothetical protein
MLSDNVMSARWILTAQESPRQDQTKGPDSLVAAVLLSMTGTYEPLIGTEAAIEINQAVQSKSVSHQGMVELEIDVEDDMVCGSTQMSKEYVTQSAVKIGMFGTSGSRDCLNKRRNGGRGQ